MFWYAVDDGIHAHIAERVLNGEVLHRDVQDIHAGYIHFANALAFKFFDVSLLSLRYPLVLLGIAQAGLLYLVMARRDVVSAVAGAVALTALSTVQFLNPTAHWYCLFLFVVLLWVLHSVPPKTRGRLAAIGFLLATMFLFRQLSGVLVSMGTVCYLLYEARDGGTRKGEGWIGRLVVLTSAAGLAWYLLSKTDILGLLLFGVWPLAVLAIFAFRIAIPDFRAVRMLAALALGGAIAVVPLVAYHAVHGSLHAWLDDTVLAAASLTRLEFMSVPSYGWLLGGGVVGVTGLEGAATVLNGAFWIALCLLAPANGFLVLRRVIVGRAGAREIGALPFLAVFYALVSVHYQIPIYLTYSVGISLAALLWMWSTSATGARRAVVGAAIALSVVGLHFHAAQPLNRGIQGIVEGERLATDAPCPSPRCGLRIGRADAVRYEALLALIDRHTRSDQAIFVLPVSPELYFLSGRRNPFRFFSTAFGIRDDEALAEVVAALENEPPPLVFVEPKDKYMTAAARKVVDVVRQRYDLLQTLDGFDVYLLKGRPGSDG